MMAIRDMGNDRLSINLAALGRYRFVAQPDASQTKRRGSKIIVSAEKNIPQIIETKTADKSIRELWLLL